MALRSVTVNVGSTNMVHLASVTLGARGASDNRILEAAIRAYKGEDISAIRRSLNSNDKRKLQDGGRKHAKIEDVLLNGISNISEAGRAGLYMLMYADEGITREDAIELARDRVKRGRPAKSTVSEAVAT